MIEVKEITKSGIPLLNQLIEIGREAFSEGSLNRWTFPVFIRYGKVFVALDCGQILGVADLIRDWTDPGLAFLEGFIIKKGYRGKGIGYSFLSEITKRLKEQGVNRLRLTVDADNSPAMRLYEKIGFQKVDDLKDEYGPGLDRLLLELDLRR